MDAAVPGLERWLPRQRWYGGKGTAPKLRVVGSFALASPDPAAQVTTLFVADAGSGDDVVYQVPLVERPAAAVADSDAIVATTGTGSVLVDGPADPAYTAALLTLVTRGGEGRGDGAWAVGRPASSDADIDPGETSGSVLSGEQSNTSVIYRQTRPPVICKVFRQVHAGLNPDIELQTALATHGSPFVPGAIGSVDGTWLAGDGTAVSGSLAFAQEFLPGVEDAWRVALRAARGDDDFTARARALGVATADVHVSLAELFPAVDAGPAERARAVASWRQRLATAVDEVADLAGRAGEIGAAYDRAADGAWPSLQRVHGDYHLGQVILVPDRGWVLLDFEGEPLRPMVERVAPDLAMRDVAGMLRSLDYVAGSIAHDEPEHAGAAAAWASASRAAFLEGYASAAAVDLAAHATLLEALELDKAVYETIYEARNRPTWLPIPVGAIDRLLRGAGAP